MLSSSFKFIIIYYSMLIFDKGIDSEGIDRPLVTEVLCQLLSPSYLVLFQPLLFPLPVLEKEEGVEQERKCGGD